MKKRFLGVCYPVDRFRVCEHPHRQTILHKSMVRSKNLPPHQNLTQEKPEPNWGLRNNRGRDIARVDIADKLNVA